MKIVLYYVTVLLFSLSMHEQAISEGKRILMIGPSPSYSHQIVYRALALALNKRGHEIVIVTSNVIHDPTLRNYTQIDAGQLYHCLDTRNALMYADYKPSNTRKKLTLAVFDVMNQVTTFVFEHPDMRKLYAADSNETFDAVIVETILGPGLYGFAQRFKAPLIGIQSLDFHTFHFYDQGNVFLTSHLSTWERPGITGSDISFWQRVCNFIDEWMVIYRWNTYIVPYQDQLARKYLGNDLPYIYENTKNMSLILVNQPEALMYARPIIPNTIFFSGFHIAAKPPPLEKKLQRFLDSAKDGFIFMSLGTNVKSSNLPAKMLQDIIKVFSSLPCKVLWKFEDDTFKMKANNVLTVKWTSQQSVLSHRNIKLFIYQGGLQSTEEAIHYGVPVIGIPMIFDQAYRIIKMESIGVARKLDRFKFDKDTFHDAISDVLFNRSYKIKMEELRSLMQDSPTNSMENVIWWIEYVMRHKGAPHLQYSGKNEPWYQRFDMDVVMFLAILFFIVSLLFLVILVRCFLSIIKSQLLSKVFEIFCLPSNRKKNK